MTIHDLLAAAGLSAGDEIPIWQVNSSGEPTRKITAQQLAAAVATLASLVTGVKGDAESSYRTGNVNLTPANIGAMPVSPASIELIPASGTTNGGFIDFHYGGSSADYTTRLMENSDGVLSIKTAADNAYYPIVSTKDAIQKALYNTNTTGITSYPTEQGLYRVTQSVTGLPTGLSNYYGVLMIYGAGTYYTHVYVDTNQNLYYAYKGSTGAPTAWKQVLPTSGGTITGTLTVTGSLISVRHSSSPIIYLQDTNGTTSGAIYSQISSHRVVLRESHTGDTNFEDYYLPAPNATGSSVVHQILTSKTRVTHTFTFTFSGATIGTRAGQQSIALSSLVDGLTASRVFGVTITNISNSSQLMPVAFLSGNSLYCNAYAAAASTSNNEVTVTISYY